MKSTTKTLCYLNLLCKLDADVFDKINDKDDLAITDMFDMHFKLSKSEKIPKQAQDPFIFLEVLKLRLHDIGFDVLEWFKESVDADGTVHWDKQPVFTATWKDDELESMCYMGDDPTPPPTHVGKINLNTHVLNEPFSDVNAHFVISGTFTKFYLRDWFPAGTGPNKHRPRKSNESLFHYVEAAVQKNTERQSNLKAIMPDTDSPLKLLGSRTKRPS